MSTPPKSPQKGKPYHSVLAPFAQDIFAWQQAGKTYQDIADLLAEKGVSIHRTTIWHWVAIRARGRGQRILLPDPSLPVTSPASSAAMPPPIQRTRTRGLLAPLTGPIDSTGQQTRPPPNPADFTPSSL